MLLRSHGKTIFPLLHLRAKDPCCPSRSRYGFLASPIVLVFPFLVCIGPFLRTLSFWAGHLEVIHSQAINNKTESSKSGFV